MEKSTKICFSTTAEIKETLNKIAEEEKMTVSEVLNNIIKRYLEESSGDQRGKSDQRRFERKKIGLSAYIGDPRWQRCDFETIKIIDISIGGIGFAVPMGTKLEIRKDSDSSKETFLMIFRLPNYHWPINVQVAPQWICQCAEEIQVGATLVNPDFYAYSALQKHLM
jgi:hypothetical protein